MSLTELGDILTQLPQSQHPNLLVGINTADDAGVFRLSDEVALIQTVDFITPIVDDPYLFGQISAANALSDIYAMGGKPLTCLNIVGFPAKIFPQEVLVKILQGGFEKITEASAVLVGGHTIIDEELKYGLSVTGIVRPDRIVTNAGAQPGDHLLLTKSLGSGIISTAIKRGIASIEATETMIQVMLQLNRVAAESMQEIGVHAATDITGFGLLGHCYEMAKASHVSLEIIANKVPIFSAAFDYFELGCIPGGTSNNQYFLQNHTTRQPTVTEDHFILMCDAQTSGGLLIAVSPEKSDSLLNLLHQRGVTSAQKIGNVRPQDLSAIHLV